MQQRRTNVPTGHLWVEEGEQFEALIAEVAPTTIASRTYSFAVPASMKDSLAVGQRVMVPMGSSGRAVQGFVVSVQRKVWDTTLRPIDSLVDSESFLTPELIELGREIARHYACPLGRTLKALTPDAVRKGRGLRTVRYARLARSIEEIAAAKNRLTEKRRILLDLLSGSTEPVRVDRLLAQAGASNAILLALVRLGWVEVVKKREAAAGRQNETPQVEPEFELSDEQLAALEQINRAIDASAFSVTLLHGVSGSGKTEVYVRAIRRVVADGRQAILLVPEIVLTTQVVGRLSARFTDVAVNHSGLTGAQRSLIWREIASGRKKVVIGTRSAVFAPCPDLGLICVDEEQENSYKNLQAPRFHVRDVAIMRAKQLGIPVLLGSATPAIETWYNSEHRSEYKRVLLPHRVRRLPLPKVHIVDMGEEFATMKSRVILSRLLERLMNETLARGEQALVLMNRRGFATQVFCPACRTRIECPHCNVGLVVHRANGQSICHYCRTRVTTPTDCPNICCRGKLVHFGAGTQRVEEVLTARFPGIRLERVDSDTMRHRRDYQRIVDDFEAREIDVLVGTQMIAKGLDFPFVSLVGVIQADAAGLATDFRTQERLFQLITQVAGRAGRADTSGQVVVQTMTPELPALACALNHDFDSFVARELEVRARVGLPPFRRLARIVLAHKREEFARREAVALAERIRAVIASTGNSPPPEPRASARANVPADDASPVTADVWGPSPCTLLRLRGKYRYDLLLRTANASTMRQLLSKLETSGALRTKAESMIIDVDPVSLA